MCDKASFREPEPKETKRPRTAEELRIAAKELAEKKKFSTGTEFQEDHIR